MSIKQWVFARLERGRGRPKRIIAGQQRRLRTEVLVQAQADWIALLATILERERVISGSELARSLAEFAAVTARDRPEEGRILSFWASRLHDTAATFEDVPSVH